MALVILAILEWSPDSGVLHALPHASTVGGLCKPAICVHVYASMLVSMCLCTDFAFVYKCSHVCTYVHMHARMPAGMQVCMQRTVHACVHACMHACMYVLNATAGHNVRNMSKICQMSHARKQLAKNQEVSDLLDKCVGYVMQSNLGISCP